MAARQLVRNATVFDSAAGRLRPGCQIVIEGERIAAVSEQALQVDDVAQTIDAGGRVVLPGLIDAHVHVVASSHDLSGLALQPPSLVTAHSSTILRDMLHRGFTTVRDAAGADYGLQEAVARGIFPGPRLFIAGFPISQTGGHADMRPKGVRQREFFCSCAGLGLIGAIADGVGEGVVIGDRNILRENVTVHRSTLDGGATIVGKENYFMVGCHLGHDVVIGDSNILANGTMLGGHVHLGDGAFLGGGTGVHQFVRLGDRCMAQGHASISQDVPPFVLVANTNQVCGLNVVGMRRAGFQFRGGGGAQPTGPLAVDRGSGSIPATPTASSPWTSTPSTEAFSG